MLPLLLLALAGCWKPYDSLVPLNFSAVPYEVDGLDSTDAVITSFESDLVCPDGEAARFFAIYREGDTGPAPVAIVFHSGPFDYILDPDEESPLSGEGYYLDSRLQRTWGVSKVWETMGLLYPQQLDDAEVNLGTLPAALTDAGVVQIYPSNCWGDLWHNWPDVQDNAAEDGFDRAGLEMAFRMIQMVIEPSAASDLGFSVPVQFDTSELYLIGLGDGGRAVSELMLTGDLPPVAGALFDSSPDLLSAYVADPDAYSAEITGLERIFGEENTGNLDAWSLSAIPSDAWPDRLGWIWSEVDSRLPLGSLEGTAATLEAGGAGWVYQTGLEGHVFTNGDRALADGAVNYLMTGETPVLDQ